MTDQASAIEHGRIQILTNAEAGTATLIVENVNRDGEHWLTLASLEGSHNPIGFIRLRPLRDVGMPTGRHVFEVVEVLQATGPVLRTQGEPPPPEAPTPKRSESLE